MRILFLGDIVGETGREAVRFSLPSLIKKHHPDFVIANGENASHGKGLTENHYNAIIASGVDAITLGNHYRSKEQIDDYIDDVDYLIRPLNVKHYPHGVGSAVFDVDGIPLRITNLLGQAFLKEEVDVPYESLLKLIESEEPCIHFVDFHAESTSEKEILGYCFDGKVSAIVGTHTHVQTNDAKILPHGTAYLSDVGMCGADDGVIGFNKESVINKIVFGRTGPFSIDVKAPAQINAVVIDFDEGSYEATNIELVNLKEGGNK